LLSIKYWEKIELLRDRTDSLWKKRRGKTHSHNGLGRGTRYVRDKWGPSIKGKAAREKSKTP